jgi:hypothetical protein
LLLAQIFPITAVQISRGTRLSVLELFEESAGR